MQDAPARQVRHQLILDIRRSRFSGPAHSQIPSSGPGHADRADRSRIVFPYLYGSLPLAAQGRMSPLRAPAAGHSAARLCQGAAG